MNFRTTRLGTPVDAQTDALAIFASPNLPSILPMGAFPVTVIALGQVSRRNLDNMAPQKKTPTNARFCAFLRVERIHGEASHRRQATLPARAAECLTLTIRFWQDAFDGNRF